MARKIPPLELISQPATPSPGETDGPNGEPTRPVRGQQPLGKEEVNRVNTELNTELTSDDRETAAAATRVCRAFSQRAAERLGLIITGRQAASTAQIVTSCVAVLKGGGVLEKGDAEATE